MPCLGAQKGQYVKSAADALEWLSRPPDSFRADCKGLAETRDELGRKATLLANYGLDGN
jgi:hypothetical protein